MMTYENEQNEKAKNKKKKNKGFERGRKWLNDVLSFDNDV